MGILDNDTVIVDAILTKIGRQKLAQGQPLGISKFAFGDTGVDYTLYNHSILMDLTPVSELYDKELDAEELSQDR